MERMTEGERFVGLSALLVFVMLIGSLLWLADTPSRMAQDGFMPLRLPGDAAIYWLPVPTDKKSHELDGMLREQ